MVDNMQGKTRQAAQQVGVTYLDLEDAMRISGINTLRYGLGIAGLIAIGSYAFGGEIKEVSPPTIHSHSTPK